MTKQQFKELNPNIFVVETHRYLSNAGIYAILENESGIIAYKNPDFHETVQSATIWSRACDSKEEAYQAINDYIQHLAKDANKTLIKTNIKKNRR